MPERARFVGSHSALAHDAECGDQISIGHASCIGFAPLGDARPPVRLGDRVEIGAFCVVERGAQLESDVSLDHYCRIGAGTVIGAMTKILYGAKIFDDCRIGARCIVGGNLDDRAELEDDVTFMASMAHSYRQAGTLESWDTQIQPSPVIRRGAVVGQGALIIGGIEIGAGAYVAAGELVRHDIPADSVLYKGVLSPIADWRGLIRSREIRS